MVKGQACRAGLICLSGSRGRPIGSPRCQGGGVGCPIGSTATFDGSSDDLYGSQGDLKGPMRLRGLFRGPIGVQWSNDS